MFKVVEGLTGDFSKLSKIKLEEICNGRSAAIMTDGSIVRSTSIYQSAPYKFSNDVLSLIPQDMKFNNAMIELYTDEYRTMKYHSDLALDLVDGSYIGIYSCYPDESSNKRKLMVKNKSTNATEEIELKNKSMVIFDTSVNSKYLHKIIGRGIWLGITFRLSKTYKVERLASPDEKKEFLKLRGMENRDVDFKWGEIEYTLSPSDLLEAQDNLLGSD